MRKPVGFKGESDGTGKRIFRRCRRFASETSDGFSSSNWRSNAEARVQSCSSPELKRDFNSPTVFRKNRSSSFILNHLMASDGTQDKGTIHSRQIRHTTPCT